MRPLISLAAVLLMLSGVVIGAGWIDPVRVAAQEEPGHILFTIRVCMALEAESALAGTFSDAPDCDTYEAAADVGPETVISLDGGQFVDGDVPIGSTITLPFVGPLLDANLYLPAGDYTFTVTTQHLSFGTLVTSTPIHVVAGATLPLTYTVIYGLAVGAEPPTGPAATPELPIEEPEIPVVETEVPAEGPAIPGDPVPTQAAANARTGDSDASSGNAVTTLPGTGSGPAGTSSRSFVLRSLLLAGIATLAGTVTIRTRRT
jgi:hypothetical protein